MKVDAPHFYGALVRQAEGLVDLRVRELVNESRYGTPDGFVRAVFAVNRAVEKLEIADNAAENDSHGLMGRAS